MFLRMLPLLALLACEGPKGPAGTEGPAGKDGLSGEDGQDGDQGDQGIPGPITEPPAITSISPRWGSGLTHVTLTGTDFSATPSDNLVTFDGWQATVVSATATELVVTADVDVTDATPVAVDVQVDNQVSNAVLFDLVPPGTARNMDAVLPTAPNDVALLAGNVYIASSSLNGGGLFVMDSTGRTERLWEAPVLVLGPNPNGPSQLADAPVALAARGSTVYFLTSFGTVWGYDTNTGAVQTVLAGQIGGDAFPPRSDLAIDSDGWLYVVDRTLQDTNGDVVGGVIRVSPTGVIDTKIDPAYAATNASNGLDRIAVRGNSEVFLTHGQTRQVFRVQQPQTSWVQDVFATPALQPKGITLVGSQVVLSMENGNLRSKIYNLPPTDPLSAWDVASGIYPATGLYAVGQDLYLAQPDASAVRKITDATGDPEIISAGMRLTFGITEDSGTWYLATTGLGLFFAPNPPPMDGAVIALAPDGSSQVVHTGGLPTGLVGTGGKLLIGDCFDNALIELTVATGATRTLIDSNDGTTCIGGVWLDSNGDIYHVDSDLVGSNPSTIGKLASGGAYTHDHVTGLPPGQVHLAHQGGTLYTAAMFTGGGGTSVWAGGLNGGTASVLASGAAVGSIGTLAANPLGGLTGIRVGLGDIVDIDEGTGAVTAAGSSLVDPSIIGTNGVGALPLSATFLADGTLVVPDAGQSDLVLVAP